MQIPIQHTSWIWCGKEFTLRGFSPAHDQRLGRVRRSQEHIIPESLFGRIVTLDVCRSCNAEFGHSTDDALLRDGRILAAADQAGFKLPILVHQFEGKQATTTGRTVRTRVKRGNFRPAAEFHPAGFRIALTNGKFDPTDLVNAKRKMLALVKSNPATQLSDSAAMAEIDNLFQQAEQKEGETIFNPTIGQGLKGTPLDKQVLVQWVFHPWETQWAIAKIAYESCLLTWPAEYVRYCGPVLNVFREFLTRRKLGTGIFEELSARSGPANQHTIHSVISPSRVEWKITFFGAQQWLFKTDFNPHPKSPRHTYQLTVTNPFRGGQPEISVARTA